MDYIQNNKQLIWLNIKKSKAIKKWSEEKKNGQKTWIDIFPKMVYRWLTGIWKDAQHCSSMQIKTTMRYHLTEEGANNGGDEKLSDAGYIPK